MNARLAQQPRAKSSLFFHFFVKKHFLSRKQRWNGYDSLHTLFSIYCFGYVTMKKSKRNDGFVEIRPILWSYIFFSFFFETSKFAKIALIMSCLRPIFSKTIVETYHICYIKMMGNTSIFQICKK